MVPRRGFGGGSLVPIAFQSLRPRAATGRVLLTTAAPGRRSERLCGRPASATLQPSGGARPAPPHGRGASCKEPAPDGHRGGDAGAAGRAVHAPVGRPGWSHRPLHVVPLHAPEPARVLPRRAGLLRPPAPRGG